MQRYHTYARRARIPAPVLSRALRVTLAILAVTYASTALAMTVNRASAPVGRLPTLSAPMRPTTALLWRRFYMLTAPTTLLAGGVALGSDGVQRAVKENRVPTALVVAGNPRTVMSPLCAFGAVMQIASAVAIHRAHRATIIACSRCYHCPG